MANGSRLLFLVGTGVLLSRIAFAQPAPVDDPNRLPVVQFSMTSGGGETKHVEDGYESDAATIVTHARMRIGAVPGRSLGPSLTVEGAGTWQRPGDRFCLDEPCDSPLPERRARFYGLAAARLGYEGRNAAIEGGVALFRCPGCTRGAGGEPDSREGEDPPLILSFAVRLGPPLINVWGEYGAGGLSAIGSPDSTFGQRTPGAIGIGHRNRYFQARVGGTTHGWMADVDVPVFDGVRVGVVAWGFEDQWAGGLRMTVPLGRGHSHGSAYRPEVRP